MSKTAANDARITGAGLTVERHHTTPGVHPFDEVEWELRDAIIGDPAKPAFEQRGVEFPKTWSQNATNIVAQKYFRGRLGSPERESSVKQMISRVAGTIAGWGREGDYFATDEDADAFEAELTHILLHQKAAFNSPVWFNVGFEEHPQCSACFILSVQDTMESILDWNTKEGMIFRGGSGSGINLSNIRASHGAPLQGRPRLRPGQLHARRRRVGRARSSPAARPAARRRWSSSTSTTPTSRTSSGARRARRRRRPPCATPASTCGSTATRFHLDPVPERQQLGPRHRRVHAGGRGRRRTGSLTARESTGEPVEDGRRPRADARDRRGGLALRRSGRPVRHDDQPLAHLPGVGADQRVEPLLRVHARRRLGLQPRVDQPDEVPPRGRQLRRRRFEHAVDVVFLAQEIVVGPSSYPTEQIGDNARAFRQLGLGYANLGALLMSDGIPYDSDEGRDVAAAITALMTGRAYRKSAEVAAAIGPYDEYEREPRAAQRRDAHAPRRRLRDRRRPASRATCSTRRARPGTRRSRSATSTATATRRRRCSRPPGRSAS